MKSHSDVWSGIHWFLHIPPILSVFFVPWYWLFGLFVLLRIQDMVFGGCVLSYAESGSWRHGWSRKNFGPYFPRPLLPYFTLLMSWLFPAMLVFTAFALQ